MLTVFTIFISEWIPFLFFYIRQDFTGFILFFISFRTKEINFNPPLVEFNFNHYNSKFKASPYLHFTSTLEGLKLINNLISYCIIIAYSLSPQAMDILGFLLEIPKIKSCQSCKSCLMSFIKIESIHSQIIYNLCALSIAGPPGRLLRG